MSERPSDKLEFDLTAFQRGIADAVLTAAPPGRWPAANAVRGLNRAWKIRSLDPEMALFRAITAEEEAATAVFHAVRRRCYEGATSIQVRNHVHKIALTPFCEAIEDAFARLGVGDVHLELNPDTGRIELTFQLPGLSDPPFYVKPNAPLNFRFEGRRLDGGAETYDFSEHMKRVLGSVDEGRILSALRDRANFRNRILYANHNGYPAVGGDIELGLAGFVRRVFRLNTIFLMVDHYSERQLFAQQALSSFVTFLGTVPSTEEGQL